MMGNANLLKGALTDYEPSAQTPSEYQSEVVEIDSTEKFHSQIIQNNKAVLLQPLKKHPSGRKLDLSPSQLLLAKQK